MEPQPTTSGLVRRAGAVALLLTAALIHVAVIAEHLREWPLAGAFFAALAAAEAVLAAGLTASPDARWSRAAVAVSLATVALWLFSRTTGLPFGPDAYHAETVRSADVVATACELATGALLLRGGQLRRPAAVRALGVDRDRAV